MAANSSFMSVEEVNKVLDKGLEKVFEQERFKELLNVMSSVNQYSLNNTIMIMTQKPQATMVQGFKAWQELERHVNKGEKAIKILAPMFKKKELEAIDPITKQVKKNTNGEPVKEKKDVLIGYRKVNVFDVSQTDGKEIPSVRDFVNRELQDDDNMSKLYKDLFKYINDHTSFDLSEGATDPGVGGYYSPSRNEIVVSNTENENDTMKFRVLVHELAHGKLHNLESDMSELPRGHKEAQAEATAYVVSKYYGMDTDDISLGYIATWSKDINLARQSIGEIQNVAKEIVNTIDELQKDRILEFYQQNEKEYFESKDFLSNKYGVEFDKDSEKRDQFELLNKEKGFIVSARLEYTEKNDKFLMKTDKNIIVPLSDVHEKGSFTVLNQELNKGQLTEISSYKRIPEISDVKELSNGKFAVTSIQGEDLFSQEYTTKAEAQQQYLKLTLAQSLHEQSFLKAQSSEVQIDENLRERQSAAQVQINFDVSKFLTNDSDRVFIPSGEDGTTIGWTLMKNKTVSNLQDLEELAFSKTKHLSNYDKLREAIENATEGNIEKKPSPSREDVGMELER